MIRNFKRAALLGAAMMAAPALAQAAPPPPPGGHDGGPRHVEVRKFVHGGDHMGRGGMMGETLAALTPEGRKTLGEAMRASRGAGRDEVSAARDRMLEILGADRLDVGALRRAMQDEQRAAAAQQQRHQDAMLDAFQKLSPRDRKAFAVSMRAQQFRMEQMRKDVESRMAKWRERRGEPMAPPPAPGK